MLSSDTNFTLTKAQDRAMDVLASDALHIAIGGGARSGKTFMLCRAVLVRAIRAPGSRHAIFRHTFTALKAAIIYETMPDVIAACFPGLPSMDIMLNKSDWFMTLPNGSEIWFCGLDSKERTEKVLGKEYCTIYFNEASEIPYSSIVIALTRLAQKSPVLRLKSYTDFNPPSKVHWTYKRFIEHEDPIDRTPYPDPFKFRYFRMNPKDNAVNLAPEYLSELDNLPERARKRFRDGEFADAAVGALWTVEDLALHRKLGHDEDNPLPQWVRIVVAVDPSGTTGDIDSRSDDIGIVVAALGHDNHGYMLEDLTGQYSPEEWGLLVGETYKRHMADCVVGESNYGGDMVRAIVHAHDDTINYKPVVATRGKTIRAEPISSLAAQGKIHMVGHHTLLEDELTGMTTNGYTGTRSPNRADAYVWAFTELFPGIVAQHEKHGDKPPRVITPPSGASRFDRSI